MLSRICGLASTTVTSVVGLIVSTIDVTVIGTIKLIGSTTSTVLSFTGDNTAGDNTCSFSCVLYLN